MKQNLTLEALRQLLERRDMCALRDALTQTHPADLAELLDELKRQELELSCEESLKVRGYHEPLVSIVEGKAMVLLNKGLIAGDSAEGVSSFVASISGVEQAQVMVVFPVAFVDDLPGE